MTLYKQLLFLKIVRYGILLKRLDKNLNLDNTSVHSKNKTNIKEYNE